MAYHRIQRRGKAAYHYIFRTERRGDRVVQHCVEYLGRDPDPKRLKRAMRYWGVKRRKVGRR